MAIAHELHQVLHVGFDHHVTDHHIHAQINQVPDAVHNGLEDSLCDRDLVEQVFSVAVQRNEGICNPGANDFLRIFPGEE